MLFRVRSFSFNLASLESIEENIEEREPVENENENTPMTISIMHSSFSLKLFPDISPNPTVVIVAMTK